MTDKHLQRFNTLKSDSVEELPSATGVHSADLRPSRELSKANHDCRPIGAHDDPEWQLQRLLQTVSKCSKNWENSREEEIESLRPAEPSIQAEGSSSTEES